MASTVRFLIACANVENENGLLVLQQVLDNVVLPASEMPCDIQLAGVVGLKVEETAWNKSLGLIAWMVSAEDGKKTELAYVDDAVIVPEVEGYTSVEFSVQLPITEPGEYGFELVDCDGVFANTEDPVATFVFGVSAAEEE
ncbi:MAG TPA: hypothetical protein VL096_00620 [Pirellulaceae bacterium]|nr:hypothetical protein [Pirellulaceae bacterium]